MSDQGSGARKIDMADIIRPLVVEQFLTQSKGRAVSPDFHFSFGSANHRVASDAFIDAGWKALQALRRATPNG